MDAGAATHALTRARDRLRPRRRLAVPPASWALSDPGLAMLRGAIDDWPAAAGEGATSRPSAPNDDARAEVDGRWPTRPPISIPLDRAARALAPGARPGRARTEGADHDDGADPLLARRSVSAAAIGRSRQSCANGEFVGIVQDGSTVPKRKRVITATLTRPVFEARFGDAPDRELPRPVIVARLAKPKTVALFMPRMSA